MTHLPPPNIQFGATYPPPPPPSSAANVWSIVSLVCGIIGCFGITAIAAVITGIVGLASGGPLRRGRGMALAGIILGLLWIAGATIGVIATVKYGPQLVSAVSERIVRDAKPQTISLLNSLADADLDTVRPQVDGISESQLQHLSDTLKPLGHCSDITVSSASANSTDGRVGFDFTGQANFEHGSKPIHARMRQIGSTVMFEELDLQ